MIPSEQLSPQNNTSDGDGSRLAQETAGGCSSELTGTVHSPNLLLQTDTHPCPNLGAVPAVPHMAEHLFLLQQQQGLFCVCFLAQIFPFVRFGSMPRSAEEPKSQGQRAAISPLIDGNWSYSWQLTWGCCKEKNGTWLPQGSAGSGNGVNWDYLSLALISTRNILFSGLFCWSVFRNVRVGFDYGQSNYRFHKWWKKPSNNNEAIWSPQCHLKFAVQMQNCTKCTSLI